jgi:hypothetical protein
VIFNLTPETAERTERGHANLGKSILEGKVQIKFKVQQILIYKCAL